MMNSDMFPAPFTGQILQRYALPYKGKQQLMLLNDLVHELAHAFEMPGEFDPAAFDDFPIRFIVDYIRRTHRLYLLRKLPEMEQSIHLLLQDYSDDHPLLCILLEFYSAYKTGLTVHMLEEEQELLPYIDFLLDQQENGLDMYQFYRRNSGYSLAVFEQDHHDDTEKDLRDIRETILRHAPPATNITPYRILLEQLRNFESDLLVHGLVEDQVLLPRMKKVEDALLSEFSRIVRGN